VDLSVDDINNLRSPSPVYVLFAEDTGFTLQRSGLAGRSINENDVVFENHFEQVVELFSVAFRLLIRVIKSTHSGYMQVNR